MKHFCVEICFQGNSVPETSVAALLCLRGGLKPHKVCIAVWPVCNCEYVRGRLTVRVCVCVCALSERERERERTTRNKSRWYVWRQRRLHTLDGALPHVRSVLGTLVATTRTHSHT